MEGSWNNIPQELKDKPQWVCYMMPMDPEKGKPDKIPINPRTLWGASSTNPDTWGTFQDAVEQVGKTGHCKRKGETISSPIVGIGFVFNGDGVAGIDFDHCIVDGKMDPWVGEWIRRFNSYVEFSPSDTGVHILCYGKLPGKSIKLDVAEMYDSGRFFTMTGKGPPRPLCEAQQALDELYAELSKMRVKEKEPKAKQCTVSAPIDTPALEDAEIIEKARSSKNGANFSALWEGDISGYNSQSEADLALCSHLAFWTRKDTDQIDRLFRRSRLMRKKWDRPQAGSTYGQITVKAAVDACSEIYEPQRKKRGRPRKSDGESKRDNRPSLYMATLEEFLQENHISVRYNQITHDVEITGVSDEYNPETLNDDLCVILHDQLKQDFKCNKNLVGDLLGVISGKHRYNPALDLISSVQWDGVQRMEAVYKLLHIPVVDWLSRALIWKWFLQGVSLLENDPRHPFGADGILVFVGPQGCGKTSFCSAVGVRPDLVKLGQYIDNRDKDTTRRCVSAWIVELGEIETTLRSDLERLKAFLTAERDEYRLPYGRADQLHARRTSFIATCNSERFLIDPTGSRRFWTVPIEKIDLDELRRFDFLQVWAEAKVYAEAHPQGFRLTPEEQAALAQRNTQHEKPLKAQLEVEDIISRAESVPGYEWRWETVSAFKMEYETLRSYSVEQIGKALEKVGILPEQKRINGSPKKVRELPFPKYGVRAVV